MFKPDKSKLDQSTLDRYKNSAQVRAIIERLDGYQNQPSPLPYDGSTSGDYIKWRTEEAMIGYEQGQADSQIPYWIRHHVTNAIMSIEGFSSSWATGNDKSMTVRQLLSKARGFTEVARERLDPSFFIAELEADPRSEYSNAYSKIEHVYLRAVMKLEEYFKKQTAQNNTPSNRRRLKQEIESKIGAEIIPVLQSAIPLLEDMCEAIAPTEDINQ